MNIEDKNLKNLSGLWKKYGASSVSAGSTCVMNNGWPHRCWFESTVEIARDNVADIPQSAIVPIWPSFELGAPGSAAALEQSLIQNLWQCTFEQTAMALPLGTGSNHAPAPRPGFELNLVSSNEELEEWLKIGSEAFDYDIQRAVIAPLLSDECIKVFLAYEQGKAVASALLFKTGDAIGVHQVGVRRDFQGQGIARSLMLQLIEICAQWGASDIVLQASKAGKPLYDSLGFDTLFTIRNFQKM